MNARSFLLTIGAIAAITLLALATTAQSATNVIYGYVTVGGTPMNGITVTLHIGPSSSVNVTTNDATGNPGYYQFDVSNGSGCLLSASCNNYSASRSYMFSGPSVQLNLSIPTSTPTPAPTVTVTPTPTPRPSDEIGGLVTRNDHSSFIPLSAEKTSPTPTPRASPKPTPTTVPDATSMPTPTPVAGILSNMYLWLVIALVAIIAIAAAAVIYMRR